MLALRLRDSKVADAVFNVAAAFPMNTDTPKGDFLSPGQALESPLPLSAHQHWYLRNSSAPVVLP